MMFYTHMAFGVLLLGLISSISNIPLSLPLIAIAAIASLLPDIDHPPSILGKVFFPISILLSKKFGHRTITHSLLFIPIIATIFSPLIFYNWHFLSAIIIGVLSHFIADGMNPTGVPLLWPDSRPFFFVPEQLLVKTGSLGEIPYFILFAAGAFAFTGVSIFGFKSLVHNLFPGFNGVMYSYTKYCDGPGIRNMCYTEADVCGEYCGPVSGTALGIFNHKLVVWNEKDGYKTLEKGYVLDAKLEQREQIEIKLAERRLFHETFKLSSFNAGLVTVTGDLAGNFSCKDPYTIDPVFRIEDNVMQLHHIRLSDLENKACRGFVYSGKLQYKIRIPNGN